MIYAVRVFIRVCHFTLHSWLQTVDFSFPGSADLCEADFQAFILEATFLSGYSHVNILSSLGVIWRRGDRPYVVLPYMALGDLRSFLQNEDLVSSRKDLQLSIGGLRISYDIKMNPITKAVFHVVSERVGVYWSSKKVLNAMQF